MTVDEKLAANKIYGRSSSIDRLRGLAIALMILDHIVIFTGPVEIRYTLTRLSMPLFFIIAGHLVSRFSWRLLAIGIVGIALPFYVSFIDSPNVLLWYALFAPVIIMTKRFPVFLYVIVGIALTFMANYAIGTYTTSYQPIALLALMALGAVIPRFNFDVPLPSFLTYIGKYPLSVYVGHLLILETITR